MRKTMHLWRNIGQFNSPKNFSTRSICSISRPPTSTSKPPPPAPEKPLAFSQPPPPPPAPENPRALPPFEVLKWSIAIGTVLLGCQWFTYYSKNMYGTWKDKRKMLKVQEKLDRKMHESPEAFVEMLDREIKALKPKLSERDIWEYRKVCEYQVKNYERLVDVLKSKVSAWNNEKGITPYADHRQS